MGQTWDDLLFLHYRVPAVQLRPLVPNRLELQEHSGSAWLGVTPFVITGLRARGLLPLPFASSFRELNVRTYVAHGRPHRIEGQLVHAVGHLSAVVVMK